MAFNHSAGQGLTLWIKTDLKIVQSTFHRFQFVRSIDELYKIKLKNNKGPDQIARLYQLAEVPTYAYGLRSMG